MRGNRPKSAKPGTKMEYQDESSHFSKDDHSEEEEPKASINRKSATNKDRLMSANYRKVARKTNELGSGVLGRILPKNIPQDKERLYFQAIKLKQQKHEIEDQNVKLKTKITVLQRQNDKLGKKVEMHDDFGELRSKSRVNSNIGAGVESSKIPAMKRLVRQAKDEVQFLKTENQKIRKSVKYTKLSELENENKILIEQMNKMSALIDDLTHEQSQQEYYQKRTQQLDSFLKSKMAENQELQSRNRELEDDLYQLEQTSKTNLHRTQEREKKLMKDNQLTRRKFEGAQREIDSLKADLNKYKNQTSLSKASGGTLTRNSRNPVNRPTSTDLGTKDDPEKKKFVQQIALLKKKNQDLQKQNTELSSTLKFKEEKLQATERENLERKSQPKSPVRPKEPERKVKTKSSQEADIDYDDEFEPVDPDEDKIIVSGRGEQAHNGNIFNEEPDDGEEQILYKEEEKPKKPKSKPKSGKKTATKKKDSTALKSLLTYRMKAQRYGFDQLKQDIEETNEAEFKVAEIESMLHNSPFFLNDKQAKTVLKLLSPDDYKSPEASVKVPQMIAKLRQLIQDFELLEQNEDDQMYLKVAQMVTTYATELETAFEEKKNPENDSTITEKSLRELFQQLELEKKYVDLIVAQLSLVSQDLEHLDYQQFFNRFYIDKEMGVEELDQEYEEENSKTLNKVGRIQEEQLEESEDSKSRPKLRTNK